MKTRGEGQEARQAEEARQGEEARTPGPAQTTTVTAGSAAGDTAAGLTPLVTILGCHVAGQRAGCRRRSAGDPLNADGTSSASRTESLGGVTRRRSRARPRRGWTARPPRGVRAGPRVSGPGGGAEGGGLTVAGPPVPGGGPDVDRASCGATEQWAATGAAGGTGPADDAGVRPAAGIVDPQSIPLPRIRHARIGDEGNGRRPLGMEGVDSQPSVGRGDRL